MDANGKYGVLAIDPGTEQSAYVILTTTGVPFRFRIVPNADMREFLVECRGEWRLTVVCEQVASYGMPVGREVFETVYWSGIFSEAWGGTFVRIPRLTVKLHLCGSARAKDSHVWQALLDRYGPGKEKAVGTKKNPGPLYGITSHMRAALALGVTFLDTCRQEAAV